MTAEERARALCPECGHSRNMHGCCTYVGVKGRNRLCPCYGNAFAKQEREAGEKEADHREGLLRVALRQVETQVVVLSTLLSECEKALEEWAEQYPIGVFQAATARRTDALLAKLKGRK